MPSKPLPATEYEKKLDEVRRKVRSLGTLLALHATRQSRTPDQDSHATELDVVLRKLDIATELLGESVGQTAQVLAAFGGGR